VDLTGSGIDLHSGDTFSVTLTYDGIKLTEKITDVQTGAVFTTTYTLDIGAVLGGNSGYVGFTAGTGGRTTTQSVSSWTYSAASTL